MERKNIESLKARLLSHLDDDCGVINVEGALAVVKELLEHETTQKDLESTRLGRYVNEFRKKTSHVELSKKGKELLRKYHKIVCDTASSHRGKRHLEDSSIPNAKKRRLQVNSSATSPTSQSIKINSGSTTARKARKVVNTKEFLEKMQTNGDLSSIHGSTNSHDVNSNVGLYDPEPPQMISSDILCDHEKKVPWMLDSSAETVEMLFNTRVPGINGQYNFRNEWRTLDKQCTVRSAYNSFLNILPYCCLE